MTLKNPKGTLKHPTKVKGHKTVLICHFCDSLFNPETRGRWPQIYCKKAECQIQRKRARVMKNYYTNKAKQIQKIAEATFHE